MNEIHDKKIGATENDAEKTQRSEAIEAKAQAKAEQGEDDMPTDPDLEEQKKRLEVKKLQAEVDEIRLWMTWDRSLPTFDMLSGLRVQLRR